jgi:hypothetical protein
LAVARRVLDHSLALPTESIMTERTTTARLALAALLLLAASAACDRRVNNDGPHQTGATEFTSQPPGGSRGGVATDGAAGAPSGAPAPAAPGAAPTGEAASSATARSLEEADIYKVAGSTLYVLNAYRGLQVVDLADLGNPHLVGRVPVVGTPVDLYLRGRTAFVLVSDDFTYVLAADGSAQPRRGSRLVAVDVADPAAPRVTGELTLDGQVEDSRLVGGVLYVVSRRWWWWQWIGPVDVGGGVGVAGPLAPEPAADSVFVASIDVTDPAHPAAVDRLELPASGWDVHANVTTERVTLSFGAWAADPTGAYGPLTNFQVVDISDPAGALVAGAAFTAKGTVRDRWGMDHDGATGLFRAVLDAGGNTGAALQIWASPAPGAVAPRSRLPIDVAESLTAARFDGPRVYVVTAARIDPLWTVDATDPAAPLLKGQVEMPGQLDFIEPRGDRLVALGHTNEAGQPWQLAASLFDVADLGAPKLLSRVPFGAGYGWIAASADDLRKAFLVFDPPPAGIGLVLVPVQGWDPSSWGSTRGTQLVDYGRDALTLRGFLGHPGAVSRAFPADAAGTRLVALSDQALQTIDAADRSNLKELARLDLARSVSALELVGGHVVELAGDWYGGDPELVVTPLDDPDAAEPQARLAVHAPSARMFRLGDVIWLLARDWSTGAGWLQAVDFADPLHPVLRGRLDLTAGEAAAFGPGWWGYGDEATLVGSALAIHRFTYVTCITWPCNPLDQVRIYDLSDPAQPHLASTVDIPGSAWSWGLMASGSFLWLTHFEWPAEPAVTPTGVAQSGRYYVDRIDLTSPAEPVLLPKVNVPGVLVAASPDGTDLTTLESEWNGERVATYLHGLTLRADGKAELRGSAALAGYPSGAARQGGWAWAVTTDWSAGASVTELAAVELGTMQVKSRQRVDGSWAWLMKATGGKLFLQAGWQEQGLLIYGLADPAQPAFEQFARTSGWAQDVVVGGGVAYLPSGPYGVPMIELAP